MLEFKNKGRFKKIAIFKELGSSKNIIWFLYKHYIIWPYPLYIFIFLNLDLKIRLFTM